MTISRSIHVAANGIISFLFYGWVIQRKTNIIGYTLYPESKKMVQMNLFTKEIESQM